MEYLILGDMSRDITSIFCILFVLTWCFCSRICLYSTTHRRTTWGSHIWSRRKVFWRHARVSRATFIAHAFKSRNYHNYKFSNTQRNDYYSLELPQKVEHPHCKDTVQIHSSYESDNAFHFFGCTVIVALFSFQTVLAFGMLGLYRVEESLGFTLLELEKSCVQDDPKIYANNSLLQGMGKEFSSDIAGDGPGYSDGELSDNSSSAEDSDSKNTQGSESSYDPIEEKKLEQKKRNAMLRAIRRRELGREARRNEIEKRRKKGPEARKSEIEKRRKKGPEARKS